MNGYWNRLRHLFVLAIGLSINSLSLNAQNLCPASPPEETGGFKVPEQVCAGTPVVVTAVPPGLSNVAYTYDYRGNGLPSGTSSTTNVYANPGTYTIFQFASGPNATGTYACRVVEVLPLATIPITFSVTTCGNLSATLTYQLTSETLKYNTLVINWGDGPPFQNVVLGGNSTSGTLTHTYATPGVKTITVTGGLYTTTNVCAIASPVQQVTVQNAATTNPVIRELTSGETSATINYQGPPGYNVELYRKDPGGAYAPTGLTGTSGVFTVPAPPTQVTCFQLVAKDACGSSERRSTEVCSLVLKAEAGNARNVLEWQPYAGVGGTFTRYFVYKNGPPAFSANTRLQTKYIDDKDVTCGKQYCYTLEATINNPNTSSQTTIRSLSTCVTGIDNSSVVAPVSAYVSVQPDGVSVQANLPATGLPTPYTVVFTRSGGGGSPFDLVGTSTTGSYLDASAQTGSQSYCYQTAIRNGCGVLSKPTAPACSILLTRTATNTLRWTSASPYANGPPQSYLVIFMDPATGASDKRDIGNVTEYRPDVNSPVTQYQVAAVNGAGVESYSNPIEIEVGLRVFLPTAFTPNGDNPLFMAKGVVTLWDRFELTIFSRWGDVMFNTTDKNTTGWNGEVNGLPATPGHYTYRIRVTDVSGKAFDRTGQVLLLR